MIYCDGKPVTLKGASVSRGKPAQAGGARRRRSLCPCERELNRRWDHRLEEALLLCKNRRLKWKIQTMLREDLMWHRDGARGTKSPTGQGANPEGNESRSGRTPPASSRNEPDSPATARRSTHKPPSCFRIHTLEDKGSVHAVRGPCPGCEAEQPKSSGACEESSAKAAAGQGKQA